MRKAKVITALALTVVMLVVMTGLAAALTMIAATDGSGNDKYTFSPGENVYVTGVNLPTDDSVDVYVTQNVSWSNGDSIANAGVILVRYNVNSTQVENTLFLGTVSNAGGTYDIPYPGTYDIVYDADQDGTYDGGADYVDYVTCTGFETIPEFATIAIPVAAILGLLFFYNYRKRKEE